MTLPVSRLVRVNINLSPLAAATRSFGKLLIVGDSNVIGGTERIRDYGTLEDVGVDFSNMMPEYLAAQLYFSQTPKPAQCSIGRWISTNSAGFVTGGILSPSQQALANFTAVTAGAFKISIDGTVESLTGLDFSGASNLNAVAGIIQTALDGAFCTWNGSQFIVSSPSTGANSIVGFATSPTSGTDISTLLQLTSSLAISATPGYMAESPVDAVTVLADKSSSWFGLQFASTVVVTDDQSIAVAAFVEALDVTRTFGTTITNANVLSSQVTNDLASRVKALGYRQTFSQYSQNPYAVASFFGRAFSVNFAANRSTITLMYKQEPSVVPENIGTDQANTLQAKNCNVFVGYNNDTAIIQYGKMGSGAYFDEIHGLDWFQNLVQTACFNLMYQSTSKIPQTDAGTNQFVNAISGACDQAINNGLIAPGIWNADGFGSIVTGQYLPDGYYIYAQPMALQSQSDRERRVAPPITIAIKLAGAIQELDVIVNVNR